MTVETAEEPQAELLPEFQEEIAGLKKTDKSENLRALNPSELTPVDYEVWRKFKNFRDGRGQFSHPEFESYQNEAISSGNQSRNHFAGFVANKLMPIWAVVEGHVSEESLRRGSSRL